METNIGKRMYMQTEALAEEIRNMNKPAETPATGLLAPIRMKQDNQESGEMESPAYRLATYFNTIRQKRMELKGE